MGKRLKQIPPPTERALVVLAGLPFATSPGVARWLEDLLPGSPKVVYVAATERDGYLYRPEYVLNCVQAATGYAERVATASAPDPAPNSLALAFVPDSSAKNLLDSFSFSAFPIPIFGLEEYRLGRQIRHDERRSREIALARIKDASTSMGLVKRRLNSYSPKEPLFLPPRNFQVTLGTCLSELFSELRDGTMAWADTHQVPIFRATREELPVHAGRHGLNVAIDARGLLFPRDLSGHGTARELADGELAHRVNFLRTLYRFGTALPSGLHHDVQFPGRHLADTQFSCCVKGRIEAADADYANIYPDDFVRLSK